MAFLNNSSWLGTSRHVDEWPEERPGKRLRTSKSHASILQPISGLVKDPFDKIGSIAESLGYGISSAGARQHMPAEERERQLQLLRLRGAKTAEEWKSAAVELDRLEENEDWKQDDESTEYDVHMVLNRLERLQSARERGDLEDMRFQIRTSLTRDLGRMGNVALYRHSHIGTKALIERYIDTVLDVVKIVVESTGHDSRAALDVRETLEQMKFARQAFGRSALLLSGGGTLGMNHIGVVKSLYEADLLPRIISGASAGSIVCAVLCSRTDEEIPDVLEQFCHGALDVFEDENNPEGLSGKARRFLTQGSIYDIEHLVRVMRGLLGDMTFQEAYNRTRRILNICVSTAELYELPHLLNYITAPDVMIWSAVAASCSVPLIFSPAQLMVKDPRTGKAKAWNDSPGQWIDGSVENDLPMTRLAEMLNVNHFIVSQVNPHVVPFLAKEEDEPDMHRPSSALAPGPSWLSTLARLAKGEALHRMHVLAELGVFPNAMTKLRSVLGQRYAGDITIMPEISYMQFPHILTNPTSEFMEQAMLNGERATWPKLSRVRNHLAVELALDCAVHELIARLAFSPSQVDLRMNAFARSSTNRTERGRSRRGSKGSHRSVRSTVLPRNVNGHSAHRRMSKSMQDVASAMLTTSALEVPRTDPADYFSSEGDGSQRSTSPTAASNNGLDDSDYDDTNSSVDSPPSPYPTRAASLRVFASVPVSPIMTLKSFLPRSPLAMRQAATPPDTSVPMPSLARPSTPEKRYKKLFHAIKPMPAIHPPDQQGKPEAPVSNGKGRMSSKPGLHLEMPRDYEISQRPQRSWSTGLRGLKPPDRR